MNWNRRVRWSSLAATVLLAACGGGGDDHKPGGGGGPGTEVPGVTESVEIIRDRNGVSHIFAQNQRDLFFAQGYNAARDRLWQLDQWRRRGEGKMAEQFGPRFVEADRAARLFLFRGDLEAEFASYHPEGKEILTAFADGVNAYVDEVKADPSKLPIEFRLTGTEPGRWSPTSSLIRIYGITRNVGTEISVARRIAAVGAATTEELSEMEPRRPLQVPAGIDVSTLNTGILANYQLARNGLDFEASDFPRSPLSEPDRQRLAAVLSVANGTAERAPEELAALQHESNNWTVSGSRTATGKPILANDPHRAISMPSLRYMVHLNAPGWNVIGAGEPALPGVSIGHNERIAFGLTIFAYGDEEDLYVYEINPANPNQYRYNGGWEDMRLVEETIPVRGQGEQQVTLKFTRHGPVVHEDAAAGKAYAVRAAYLEFPGTAAYLASLRLNQADNWTEFTEGMARHYTPGENMVYADVDGNIGWFGGALVPIRPNPDWSGLLPVPGDGRYEWAGHLPGSQLPRIFNPPEGYFATANQFNVPDDYTHRNLTNTMGWAEPYRFDRIVEVLDRSSQHTVEDSAKLQIDQLSIPARTLVPMLNGLSSPDADVAEALRQLLAWDYVATVESVPATIFEVWMPKVLTEVSNRVIPAAGRSVFGTLSKPKVFERLANPDDVFGADPVAGRNALLLETLKSTMTDLKTRMGSDVQTWKWGSLHHIKFDHELAEFLNPDLAGRLATSRFPVGGTNDTVHRASYRSSDFRVTSGASFRQVIDVGNWDNSLAINVPGQSADPESPYYDNLLEAWSKGEYFPLAFSRGAIERAKADTTRLRPER
ncbi:MAG: penicillin acylase family protein [Pigmentiphaga sp.]|uniref:penicillin acylase family protein n=1 Tax=Pigmentiphaga sp. TaxID=1977564 RepID=UPI0029B4109E|nr:penicillin acylase family protein [Pigmentiphaga sp.]MDX3906592.1 penicillin acylase family protein [Pigmentiphaga sp.]